MKATLLISMLQEFVKSEGDVDVEVLTTEGDQEPFYAFMIEEDGQSLLMLSENDYEVIQG